MLNRLTVSALLQSVIVVMAACVVTVLSISAWDSWGRLNVAGRISTIAEASGHAFKAMHNLRTDRSSTFRTLNGDVVMQPDTEAYIRRIRDAEMPAMKSAAELLASADFPGKATLLPELNRLMQALIGLQTESWDQMSKPKASRRAGLAKEYMDNTDALLATLDKLSAALAAAVNHSDPVIDQLLSIKQMAWLMRNTSGDASVMVSNGLATGKLPQDGQRTYTKLVGGIETAWNALEIASSGAQLPPGLVTALAAAKASFFEPQYLALRDRLINAVVTGEKPEMPATAWTPLTVDRMSTAVAVAERALDEAKGQSLAQWSAARHSLILQLLLVTAALALAIGSMIAVTRRVITPLHTIRDAMLKVAAGYLVVDAGYSERKDEIGALAGALETFKQQAKEKAQIEQQERNRNADATHRQQAIEQHIGTFEVQMRDALNALGNASDQMNTTSDGMSAVSSQTNARVQVAAKASGEASTSVQNVASASEQLSASINDISRQAAHAAGIASRAVSQAQETDGTVQGLAKTASRIGEVVGLINDIASQTNLLALNATIEAARAGEAGRGFAVVASEVKSLASQTAKATDDISEQIADIQKVANEAIDAIKAIGGIIGEVNEVATAIAAAVEEQGAATQEITRSTQQAAQGTKNVSDNITGVSADADAAGAAAQNVKLASETLAAQTRQLGAQVTDFLGKIRAA
ncbi:MAG: methyl-accepting chemotaxis protein [Tardiphaga sp.]|nr:methyl-accepting chemotaxis protein [Tardiphaga sp.]